LRANPERVSVHGESRSETWFAEANTPRVLASAQKIHVLAAVVEQCERDPEFLERDVPFEGVRRHYLAGTDDGAHERALSADGFGALGPDSGVLSVSRLLVHALHHSSNAAADAVADVVDTTVRDTLPPRISQQFREAYLGAGGEWQHLHQPPSTAAAAAAWRTHVAPVATLTESMSTVSQSLDRGPALRYLPRVPVYGVDDVRGKLGELPGHRAGTLVRRGDDGSFIIGSYAISGLPVAPEQIALADAVELVLRAIAVQSVKAPFITYVRSGSSHDDH
jgi:hypothetical protein